MGSAVLALAREENATACGLLLSSITRARLMMDFWMTLVQHEPATLRWMGQHDAIACHFFLPMPCPNREWTLEYNANRDDPVPEFRRWWAAFPAPWQNAIVDHLRVEWRRRFIGQSKLYWLLDNPTLEQTTYVSTLPQPVYDFPRLEQVVPNAFAVVRMIQELQSSPKLQRAAWIAMLEKQGVGPEMSTLPPLSF